MHDHDVDRWSHAHDFLGDAHRRNEKRVWWVVAITAAMMVAEIVGGTIFGSLAVVADGWHMGTHVVALAVAGIAYRFARRHAADKRFAFGTGKVGDLAAFASAIALALVAVLIGYESVARLMSPVPIAYTEAIVVAVIGLAVNIGSAFLLHEGHAHGHGHEHAHDHDREHEHEHEHHDHHLDRADHNLRAAYVHVLADAATSVLAIVGLLAAASFGIAMIDPLVGVVGTAVILRWAYGLARDAGRVLVDAVPDAGLERDLRAALEVDGDRVTDLHLWRVGPGHSSAIVSIVTHDPRAPSFYKAKLVRFASLSHVTVEVERCAATGDAGCVSAD